MNSKANPEQATSSDSCSMPLFVDEKLAALSNAQIGAVTEATTSYWKEFYQQDMEAYCKAAAARASSDYAKKRAWKIAFEEYSDAYAETVFLDHPEMIFVKPFVTESGSKFCRNYQTYPLWMTSSWMIAQCHHEHPQVAEKHVSEGWVVQDAQGALVMHPDLIPEDVVALGPYLPCVKNKLQGGGGQASNASTCDTQSSKDFADSSPKPFLGATHEVIEGDSLSKLAKNYYRRPELWPYIFEVVQNQQYINVKFELHSLNVSLIIPALTVEQLASDAPQPPFNPKLAKENNPEESSITANTKILCPLKHCLIRNDEEGLGHFHSTRDGGSRPHEGIDLLALPNEPVYAPINGVVWEGNMKKNSTDLPNIHVKGKVGDQILDFSLGYATLTVLKNSKVTAGDEIGRMIDLSQTKDYKAKKRMKNHMHIFLYINGNSKPVDPTPYLLK